MKKILYIFLAAVIAFSSCVGTEIDGPGVPGSESDAKVTISFPISIPTDGLSTRAMGNKPDVKNIFVAVFGGGGYFNEWVPAEYDEDGTATQYATENEVVYNLKVKLTTSASRLSLHIIANSPLSEPPITGISSDDMEGVVMSKVRSKVGSEPNDAYWGKIILPFGVKDSVIVTNGVEQPYLINGERVPTALTVAQFAHWNPIPLIRNFARIRVQKDAGLDNVTIDRIGLVYAPAEGPVAPILANTYTADMWGNPITVADGDETTQFWNESFLMDYEGKTIEQLGAAPYNFKGYSPADQTIGTYPASLDEMTPWSEDNWQDTYLYLYERAKPRSGQKPTRVIIHAKNGSEDPKFYALDIVDANGEPEAFLRNFTYTLTVTDLAVGSGETTIAKAADATAADVSQDQRAADLTEVSDGVALIAASYIDTTAIKAGTYSVMYRFVPKISTNVENNNPSTTSSPVGVSIKVGYNNGVDGFVENANSANGNAFSSNPAIELNSNSTAKLYVRSGNGWAVATAAQIADASIEKWGHIIFTTTTVDKDGNPVLDDGYYTKGFTKTIRIIGTKDDGSRLYRDVQVNLIPRKDMIVQCLDKYIEEKTGAEETVRIFIPSDITRSMFPLEFKIQPEAASLTPRDGDNLPVQSGKSIIPGKETQSAFHFIKTLSKSDYEAARDTVISGVRMKYFDCKFKSSKATSATTVYVANEYFNEGSDDFKNFIKRLFTADSPGDIEMGTPVTFTFRMDNEHTGSSVWHDAENISVTSRVIPKVITVTLTGIQPQFQDDGIALVDSRLVKGAGAGVYYYYEYTEGESVPSNNSVTLHLEAGNADSYSIQLSTSQISPNPGLYEIKTVTGNVVKSQIQNPRFTNTNGNTITIARREAGLPVQFRFTYGGSLVPVTFKLQGLTTTDSRISGPDASGLYTYTPTGTEKGQVINFTTTDATTECQLTNFAVADESYRQPSPDSFNLRRRNGYFSVRESAGTYGWTTSTVNPDSDMYYAYQSNNYHIGSSIATMRVTVVGYTEFTVYIRSYSESNYDYTVARKIGASALTSWYSAYDDENTKAYTNSTSGMSIDNYTAVTFTTADGLTDDETPHTFYIQYGKDGYWDEGDDRGYVLIPKEYSYNEAGPVTTTVSFDPSDFTFNNNNNSSATKDGVTISFNQSTKENGFIQIGRRGRNNNYDGTMTVSPSSGMTVTNVSLTFVNDSNYADPSKITTNPTGWNSVNGEWSGSSSGNIVFTGTSVGGNGGNIRYNRITQIVVTLTD